MKRQYRLSTEANWQSMFGLALLALVNTSGSGRKLTLRSLELSIQSVAGATSAQMANATLWQCASAGGENMNFKASSHDSSVALPATVVVRRGGGGNSYTARLRRIVALRAGAAAGTQNTLNNQRSWGRLGGKFSRGGLIRSAMGSSVGTVEPITVPQNTAIVLMADTVQASMPVRVHAQVSIDGKTATWEYVTATRPGLSLFSLENTGSNVVKLLSLGIQEVGTTDTPYLRLVPVGQIYGTDVSDSSRQIQAQLTPMDSTYPALSALTVFTDVGFVPYGVPENYMTDTTAGSPRGFNYLHTKDFNGPVLRIAFPEMEINKPGGAAEDMLGHGHGHRNADIGVRHSGITINPGEGLAIVASAETAVGVQAAFSGWPSLHFAAQIDDEPQFSPYLTLTGLVAGSDIVILDAGTGNILNSLDSYGGTSYAWNYDPDSVSNVDVCIYKPGQVPMAIRNLALGVAGASIPIQQVADRNYQ
jgi:hypothetical protein